MTTPPISNTTKVLIRVFAWDEVIEGNARKALYKAKPSKTVKRSRRAGPEDYEIAVETAAYFSKKPPWPEPRTAGGLKDFYDEWKDDFTTRLRPSPEDDSKEVLIFLLDSVPEEFIPLVCLLWSERLKKGFGEDSEAARLRVPCHLAVLSQKSLGKFDACCVDPEGFIARLESLYTFSLEAPILLTGPSGTGKTFFAGFLHRLTRRGRDFKRVNLGSLSSEPDKFKVHMEGHTKHAFTGTGGLEKNGFLQELQHGTIFFDELDGLTPENQVQMLTYTDDTKRDGTMIVRKYGAGAVDEKIKRPNMVFATNRDIRKSLREGRLRPDFLYRFRDTLAFDSLHAIFRPRHDETNLQCAGRGALVAAHLWFFLMKLKPLVCTQTERFWKPCPTALWNPDEKLFQDITKFPWSGNLRTLEKYCRHLINLDAFNRVFDWESDWEKWASAQYTDPSAGLVEEIAQDEEASPHFPAQPGKLEADIQSCYRGLIEMALERTKDSSGKIRTVQAAKALGIDSRTLGKKMKALGVGLNGDAA